MGDIHANNTGYGKIAEAWFCMDGYDPQALSEVFSFATSE